MVTKVSFADLGDYFQRCIDEGARHIEIKSGGKHIFVINKDLKKKERDETLLKVYQTVGRELNLIDEAGNFTEECERRLFQNFGIEKKEADGQ